MTINSAWQFYKIGEEASAVPVHLPHTWNTDAYVVKDYWKGEAWYTRKLDLPDRWRDKQVFMTFEAVSKSAMVYVNDQLVGSHSGGYTAFTLDITPYCSFDRPNTVKVLVDNATEDVPPISADFTFFGGIYRDVWLTAVPKQHISLGNMGSKGVFVKTPEVSKEEASMVVSTELRNDGASSARLLLETRLVNPSGETIRTEIKKVVMNAGAMQKAETSIEDIQHPDLWSPENPKLYRVEVTLKKADSGDILDQVEVSAGFRWFSFDAAKGFFLNGRPYKLRGVCRHQDQQPLGVALSDDMHRRDMRLIKDMGANFIRISHYPQDAAIIEMCDRMGLLVWEEIPVIDVTPQSAEYAAVAELNLREMIRQHYNHPSVILWGYMNEILLYTQRSYKGQELALGIERALDLAHRLEKVLKEEDPFRSSVMAYHGSNSYNTVGLGAIADVAGWNLYSGWYGNKLSGFEDFLDDQHQEYPENPIIVSEYGAGSDRRIHALNTKRFDFSIEYQQTFIEHYVPVIEERDFVLGGAYWNFIDFASAKRDESMPRINNKGLVYANRAPKDVYYYFKAMWRDDVPVLHLASRDWSDRTGIQENDEAVIQPVKIYTNLDEVELFINGQSLGVKTSQNRTVVYQVPFSDGQHFLRVAGTYQGRYVEDGHAVRFSAIPSVLDANNMEGLELAINVGSNSFFTSAESQLTWLPDQAYQPGGWGYLTREATQADGTTSQIHLTTDNPLYQSLLKDLSGYRFDVPEGLYEVELLFADIYGESSNLAYLLSDKEGEKTTTAVFKISMNGEEVEEGFSPSQLAGPFTAIKKRYIVEVENEGLKIEFEPVNNSPFLNGIKIRKL
jgi:beta-galactosidase